jgi:hypothetical protein
VAIFAAYLLWRPYNEMKQTSQEFSDETDNFPVMNKVMDNLPAITLIIAGIIIIVMVAKQRSGI